MLENIHDKKGASAYREEQEPGLRIPCVFSSSFYSSVGYAILRQIHPTDKIKEMRKMGQLYQMSFVSNSSFFSR